MGDCRKYLAGIRYRIRKVVGVTQEYMIEVKDAFGNSVNKRAVPTESSHQWWKVLDPDGPHSLAHHQQWHRSEIGRIRKMVPASEGMPKDYLDYMWSIRNTPGL